MRVVIVAFFSLLVCFESAAATPPAVVASIPPLHSLVSALMVGVSSPELLLPPNASPHAYALKPSQARALSRAGLVFRVGPALETFLDKPLRSLGGKAQVVAMQDLPGLRMLPLREGGVWGEHQDQDGHYHAGFDPHLWLDIDNAMLFASAAAAALAKSDPENAATYAANREALLGKLQDLDDELRKQLAPVADKPFLVFHDAYQYFDARYSLAASGSVTVAADRQPGARRVAELRSLIRRNNIRCVFREPQFSPSLIQPIVADLPVQVGVLDPLGSDPTGGPEQYFHMMRALGRALRDCLGGTN